MEKNKNNLEGLPPIKNNKSGLLGLCMDCKSVRIDDDEENEVWIKKEFDSDLYNLYFNAYKDNLTHGICEPCMERRGYED